MKEPESYQTSSCAEPQDAEGARLPEPLWDDPDYRRREREWNATAGDGWPHPEPQSAPEQIDMPYPCCGHCHHPRHPQFTGHPSPCWRCGVEAHPLTRELVLLEDTPHTGDGGSPLPEPLPPGWVRLPDGYAGPVSLVPLEDTPDPPYGTCPYYLAATLQPGADPRAMCGFGCTDEPRCLTGEPEGGWPPALSPEQMDKALPEASSE